MTVRWGFIGAGWIARQAMAPAVHAAGNAVLQAVASRDVERSELLAPVTARQSYEVDYPAVPSSWQVLAGRYLPFGRRYRVPGFMSVLLKAAEVGTMTSAPSRATSPTCRGSSR